MPSPELKTKGQRTRERVLLAALALIEESGISVLSQDAAARRAGISQSTLRHYFATKDDLIDAIFERDFSRFYEISTMTLLKPEASPADRLLKLVRNHVSYAMTSSDRVAFESFGISARHDALRKRRQEWYLWVHDHYAALLAQIRPDLAEAMCHSRATALLTLSLGTWIAFGKSLANPDQQAKASREILEAARNLIEN